MRRAQRISKNRDKKTPSQNEKGAVLLTTLLVMAIMAALAVTLMEDIRLALKRTANISDYAQADWYVRGAEDYVANVLAARLGEIDDDAALNQIIAKINPIVLPLEGGVMRLTVRDGSHCFNLNSLLIAEGSINKTAEQHFRATLSALNLPPNETALISERLLDWIDADSQRRVNGAEDGDYLRRKPAFLTPNTELSSVMELRAIEGLSRDVYTALQPWMCLGASQNISQFNINLAEPWQAPLLAGFMGGLDNLAFAQRLIQERPPQGYASFADIEESAIIQDLRESGNEAFKDSLVWSEENIITKPESLWVELELTYRNVQRARSFYFTELDNTPLRLTYRGWGKESFRANLRPQDETRDNETPNAERR